MILYTIAALFFIGLPVDCAFKTQHVTTPKGKFFVHTLHSAYFFPTTVKTKWEATLRNKPALPMWLRLMPSRHPEIAYLIGTPVSNAPQVTIHIIAKRIDNFEIQQQNLVITLVEDVRYTENTKQVFDIHITNLDAEELVTSRNKKIEQLENAIKSTFRGKGVNPYIFDIRPKFVIPPGQEHMFRDRIGAVVRIGTQRGFYPNTFSMVQNLQGNRNFCKKSSLISMNKFFAPVFNVDWCYTNVQNITISDEPTPKPVFQALQPTTTKSIGTPEPPPQDVIGYSGYNFLNSVILFPIIGIVCVILVFVLSFIFFGCREGQNWRDYKTEKLEEYVSVRRSQKHLRELSVQRQLLSMAHDQNPHTPTGFVPSQLREQDTDVQESTRFSSRGAGRRVIQLPGSAKAPAGSTTEKRLKEVDVFAEDTIDLLPATEMLPVGKQTVAEAAKQCGSSLHLYRNPLDSESDDNDSDSLEEKCRE